MKEIVVDKIKADRTFLPPFCSARGIRVDLVYCQVTAPKWTNTSHIGYALGLDPGGVNSGLCYLERYWRNGSYNCVLAQIRLPKNLGSVERVYLSVAATGEILRHPKFRPVRMTARERLRWNDLLTTEEALPAYPTRMPCIGTMIEAAAFGAKFGQTQLAEARAGMIVALQGWGKGGTILTLPPASLTKEVLGSGKLKFKEYFMPELKRYPDGASALGCALFMFRKFGG